MIGIEPLVFNSLWIAATVLVIVTIGAIIQAGLGMGFGLTVAPVLALVDPALVPAPALFLGMSTSLVGAVAEKQEIVWPEVGIGTLGRTTGIAFGAILLTYITDRSTFQLVFGILIALAVSLSVVGWRVKMSTRNLLGMGWISGFMGVITSVGAPPLALIYQSRDVKKSRPTLAAFFAIGCAMSLAALYLSGWAGVEQFWLACFMAPAAVLGTLLGNRLKGRVNTNYRPYLLSVAGVASVLLIVQGLV
jgi:uncharacterized membrane protein YfcA